MVATAPVWFLKGIESYLRPDSGDQTKGRLFEGDIGPYKDM